MPLIKSSSKPAFVSNMKAELSAGKPKDQALAIAYSVKRRNRAAGGITMPAAPWQERAEARSMMHTGPINSTVPGRTDAHHMNVPSGAYVVPAYGVSHLGQNNTAAGQAVLGHMFSQGPYGSSMPRMGHGAGAPHPHAPSPLKVASSGGSKGHHVGHPVPIAAAGGEYVIPPEAIIARFGNLEDGHKFLDHWMKSLKKKHAETLRKLPGPAKD